MKSITKDDNIYIFKGLTISINIGYFNTFISKQSCTIFRIHTYLSTNMIKFFSYSFPYMQEYIQLHGS